jgi:hypothetical protein
MDFINASKSECVFALDKFAEEVSATLRPVSYGSLSSDEIV